MTRLIAMVLLLVLGLPARAAELQRVPAGDLVAAARTLLEAKANGDHIAATFAVVGHVNDLSSPVAGAIEVHAAEMQGPWLRSRVGVPVVVTFADGKTTTVTVWFSVTAPAQAAVYDANYARGTLASQLQMRSGAIDLARTRGRDPASTAGIAGHRLRHAVLQGAAVLADDFEPVPAVQVQQSVRIDAVAGVVHLSTTGRALSDGSIGQIISVLPANASLPVHARVVSTQVVTIEN